MEPQPREQLKNNYVIGESQTDKVQVLTSKESKKISKMMQNYEDLKK